MESLLLCLSIHLYCISPPFLQPPLRILLWKYAQSSSPVISSAAKRSREISYRHASPLHWPHSIERNAGSSFWKELGGALRNTEINFQKFYSSRGSKNRTFCDISIRGMKRPYEMMNPISKLPSFISAVRGGQGNEETSGNSTFQSFLLLKSADDRQKKMQEPKQKTEKQ